MSRAADERRNEAVPIRVRIIANHSQSGIHDQRGVFRGLILVVRRDRTVVHGVHLQRDRGHAAQRNTVAHQVAETIHAVEVLGRRVGEGTVWGQTQRAVEWPADQGGRERIPVGVAVVTHHSGSGNRERSVLVQAEGVVAGDRLVVDAAHRDADGGQVAGAGCVAGLIDKAIGAVKVGCRRVDKGAIRGEGNRPIGRPRDELCRHGVAVGIAVVVEHARGGGNRQNLVLVHGEVVVLRDRRASIPHPERDGGELAAPRIFRGPVHETVDSRETHFRRVTEAAGGIEGQ